MEEKIRIEAFKIPTREKNMPTEKSEQKKEETVSFERENFAEIELFGTISSETSIPSSQPVRKVTDEKRKVFNTMRQIARESTFPGLVSAKFYNIQVQQENSRIFYKQAKLMKDFEDAYEGYAEFTSYFPNYQLMSYEQLRTYFTWRTKLRHGEFTPVSLSYAFVYIYELLNNAADENPQEVLEKLMNFLNNYGRLDNGIESYIIKWLKDFHIYYETELPFAEFIKENNLEQYYPKVLLHDSVPADNFELMRNASAYNFSHSAFYNNDKIELFINCVFFVKGKLQQAFSGVGMNYENLLFHQIKKALNWQPFKGALFYPHQKQRNRRLIFSEKEIYHCQNNKWTFTTAMSVDSGKNLVTFILKQTEAALRELTGHKQMPKNDTGKINQDIIKKLAAHGLTLQKIIDNAVYEYYAEATKTVVNVDENALKKIRKEALGTQEKLVVPENEPDEIKTNSDIISVIDEKTAAKKDETDSHYPNENENSKPQTNNWEKLKAALSITEKAALKIILNNGEINEFALKNGIMPEVLTDSINEKAVDIIGDHLLESDSEIVIYEEYLKKVSEIIG